MDVEKYEKMCLDLINDQNTYRELGEDSTRLFNGEIEKLIQVATNEGILDAKGSDDTIKPRIFQFSIAYPRFIRIYKIH